MADSFRVLTSSPCLRLDLLNSTVYHGRIVNVIGRSHPLDALKDRVVARDVAELLRQVARHEEDAGGYKDRSLQCALVRVLRSVH